MISFKQFLSEDTSKTKSISAEDAIAWMEANAKNYLKNGNYLYRGFNNEGIQLGNSEDFTRKSVSGPNIYTLWIDNHPTFKDFPKRSKSFICTTQYAKANAYGNTFFVISKDNNKVGIVNNTDIWNTKINGGTLYRLESITQDLLRSHKLKYNLYKTLKNSMLRINDDELYNLKTELKIPTNSEFKNLYELWNTSVTSDLYSLKLASNISKKQGEMWIQGECLFLSTSDSQLSAGDRDKILDWTEEYPKFKSFLLQHWLAT